MNTARAQIVLAVATLPVIGVTAMVSRSSFLLVGRSGIKRRALRSTLRLGVGFHRIEAVG